MQFLTNEFAHENLARALGPEKHEEVVKSPFLKPTADLGCGLVAGVAAAIASHPGFVPPPSRRCGQVLRREGVKGLAPVGHQQGTRRRRRRHHPPRHACKGDGPGGPVRRVGT